MALQLGGILAAEYRFSPRKHSQRARYDLEDSVIIFMGTLQKSYQVLGEELIAWVDGVLHVTCYVPRPDALSEQHWTEHSKKAHEKVMAQCSAQPTYRILDTPLSPKRYSRWQTAGTLYFSTGLTSIHSPIHSGKTGETLPLYLFPLEDVTKEHIYFWAEKYKLHDLIWLYSGALEIPAYREMADPHSDLSEDGRFLCEKVEKATGLPTYYDLERYWGRRKGEENRVCPNCGQPWINPFKKKEYDHGVKAYDFLCKPCRLVSSKAVSFEDERHARIGEYQGKPPAE